MTPEQEGSLRHIKQIQALDGDEILIAYCNGYHNPNLDPYDPIVKAVLEGRLLTRIAAGAENLALISEQSTIEVKRLVASSLRIETLTTKLVWLTVVLGVLTLVLVLDVGNKFIEEYFSPLPQLSVPQTPTLLPH